MHDKHTDIYQVVTDKIVAAIEAGTPPWVRPWRAISEPIPINASTKRPYRGVNFICLQIEAQIEGYTHNRWMTYRQANERGGQVRKGERGTTVVFWKLRALNATVETEPWRTSTDVEERIVPLLRQYTVFNTAQIDGLPAEPNDLNAVHPEWQPEDGAESLVHGSGADIRHGGFRAYYQPSGDYVQLPGLEAFSDSAAYYATALHELTHWTGHRSRLNRDLAGRFGDESYAMEELVAELGAAYLCAHSQIDGRLQHASYLQNWLKVLRQDKRAIFVASTKAQNAADYLIGRSTGTPIVGVEALAA